MPSSTFSENIFEAIVKAVDYKKGVCSLEPLNLVASSLITEVPLPYHAGSGNTGSFISLRPDTRVVAAFTSGRSRNVTVIIGVLPNPALYPENFDSFNRPSDLPRGVGPYPQLRDGDLIFKANAGAKIGLLNNGDIEVVGVNGAGLRFKKARGKMAGVLVAEDFVQYSNAGRVISGAVRRISGTQRKIYPTSDLSVSPLFSDVEFAKNTKPLGFFTRSKAVRTTFDSQIRNPELAEYRMIINEFTTDSMFTGFDDEVRRAGGRRSLFQYSETKPRNREPSNLLHLAEHELIEFVGGNLVDINGSILDLNYKKLYYGDNNKIPSNLDSDSYEEARRISRRGIGCHFQLTTNTKTEDKSISNKNFVVDVDKEGVLKLNVPASTGSGNIPFSSVANYSDGNGDSVIVTPSNPSIKEKVPVTLRNADGEVVFPKTDVLYRQTGVRVSDKSGYFSVQGSATGESRFNSTKYHNMYAAAERLIANKVANIYIPPTFTDSEGAPSGSAGFKPFEISKEDDKPFPTYMSTVEVIPSDPAIYHGGGGIDNLGTAIAGRFYQDTDSLPPYSNTANTKEIESGTVRSYGGKSIHATTEGSIEMSIGRDDWDQKSIVLDTYGSIISWLGKDKNGRSMVLQTDGDVMINIGGSYPNTPADGRDPASPKMNVGRLDLRVNVVDKGFLSDESLEGKSLNDGGSPGCESDYLISISEKGLVIAGMKREAPMVIRNDGPILLESSSAAVTLKGTQVITVDQKGVSNIISTR